MSTPKVLPVKTYLSFKKINAAAAQGKVTQFNDEFKASSSGLAIDDETAASLAEAFKIVAADKPAVSETYDPSKILALVLQWDDSHRFPCGSNIPVCRLTQTVIDLLRVLALLSPAFGGISSAPGDLLQAAGWGAQLSTAKMAPTNQVLAMRTLANLFLTGNGRQTMLAVAEQGFLLELVKGRKWAEVGTAKQPLATVALK